jgi:hypothetical protein
MIYFILVAFVMFFCIMQFCPLTAFGTMVKGTDFVTLSAYGMITIDSVSRGDGL